MASLCHNVHTIKPKEQHKFCSVLWCKWQQDQQDETANYKHAKQQSKRLLESYLPPLITFYIKLSDAALLKRCVPGLIQNHSEAFSSTIWQGCSKKRYFSAKFINVALVCSSIAWNIGKISIVKMLNDPT